MLQHNPQGLKMNLFYKALIFFTVSSSVQALPKTKKISYILKNFGIAKHLLTSTKNEQLSRKMANFGIQDYTGHFYFLEEYLSQSGHLPIKKVNNITKLTQDRPLDFIKLVLKSIPKTKSDMKHNLKSYYKDIIQINDLVADLPRFESDQEKLAAVITTFALSLSFMWENSATLLSEQVEGEIWGYDLDIKNSFINYFDSISQVLEQVMGDHWGYFLTSFSEQIIHLSKDTEWEQIWSMIDDHLSQHLKQYQFQLAQDEQQLSAEIIPAIDYILTIYQLALISFQHSDICKSIINGPNGFAAFIDTQMPEERARDILNKIELQQIPNHLYILKINVDITKGKLNKSQTINNKCTSAIF